MLSSFKPAKGERFAIAVIFRPCLVARDIRERDIVNNSFILKSSTEIGYKIGLLSLAYCGFWTLFPYVDGVLLVID